MKVIRLSATMSLLEIDRQLAREGLRLVRFLVGREAKKRNGQITTPERRHALIVVPA